MFLNGSLIAADKRRSSNTGIQNFNQQDWQKHLQQKWFEHEPENFEYELRKMFCEFLYSKRKKREIIKWFESIPSEYYDLTKNSPLHFATSQDNHDVLGNLISAGYKDFNSKNAEGKTPLVIAILNHNKSTAKLLLKAGSALENTAYDRNFGPLHFAAAGESFGMVKMLINANADINALDDDLNAPLHALLAHERAKESLALRSIVEMLIKAGADIHRLNLQGLGPLHLAILNGYAETALILLEAGAGIADTDKQLRTPLHLAVQIQDIDLMGRFIDVYRADVNAADTAGMSPLCYAVRAHNYTLTKMLLDYGAFTDVFHTSSSDSIYEAVRCRDYELLDLVLKSEPDLKTDHEFECLEIAASHGCLDLLKRLIAHGLRASTKGPNGYGVLHRAINSGVVGVKPETRARTVKYLLSCGAATKLKPIEVEEIAYLLVGHSDVESVRSFVERHANRLERSSLSVATLLELAAGNKRHRKVFKFVVDKARHVVNERISYGNTLLHRAVDINNLSALKYLLKVGADAERSSGSDGCTALHRAVEKQRPECVQSLLLHGADVGRKDSRGKSPLQLAVQFQNADCTRNLVKHVAFAWSVGRDIDPEGIRFIESRDDLHTFFRECERELKSMRERRLAASVSLLDVLTSARLYFRNSTIVDAIAYEYPFKKYPIYAAILKKNLREVQRRPKLTDGVELILMRLLDCDPNKSFPTVVDNILRHLSNRDLRALALVFEKT